jgi:hypothetical protein
MQSRAARSPASFRSMQRGHVCNFTCHIFIYSMSSCGHDAPQGEPEEQLRALRTLANMSKRSASAVPVKTVQDGFRNFGAFVPLIKLMRETMPDRPVCSAFRSVAGCKAMRVDKPCPQTCFRQGRQRSMQTESCQLSGSMHAGSPEGGASTVT